jgi:hypothetical protein
MHHGPWDLRVELAAKNGGQQPIRSFSAMEGGSYTLEILNSNTINGLGQPVVTTDLLTSPEKWMEKLICLKDEAKKPNKPVSPGNPGGIPGPIFRMTPMISIGDHVRTEGCD